MADNRRQGKKTTSQLRVQILNRHKYNQILARKKTFEFHLTRALFPTGSITPSALERVVSRKLPTSGSYNVVFHFGRKQENEVTEILEQARSKMVNSNGNWFVRFTDADRAATAKRVKKLVPRGMVKSSVIDAALASHTG